MKLPIPQRGQPVDVTLLSDIIASINDLYNQISIKVSAYASLWTVGGRKQVRSTEIKFYTNQVTVPTNGKKAGENVPFEGSFDVGFANPPVVSATPVGNFESAKSSTAVITEVTQSTFKGIVRLAKGSGDNVKVNIIAIGIPT